MEIMKSHGFRRGLNGEFVNTLIFTGGNPSETPSMNSMTEEETVSSLSLDRIVLSDKKADGINGRELRIEREAYFHLDLDKTIYILGIEESLTKPYLKVSNESLSWVKDFLKTYDVDVDKHILIGVNPGAAYGSAKCWPKERFAKVAEYLSSFENVRVLFFAPPDQKSMIDDICAEQNKRVLNLAGKTNLEQLLGMIKTSDIMLSNDSGPMHLSYALETPVVAIFGSTNEVATGPYCLGRVIHKHVSCSPCYLRKCPVDFRCMKAISVEEVCQNLKNFLKEHSSKVF
ncbi:hypothetical protein AB751O23_AV_00030 [Chlamydiales bacterium SCGC AB-751-O23]|nr:hypothetical protein AB751O23_AV_00030 [Chlamydiales bacterium SCGC AB-751-O23]